jgi:hypothetical protein
MGAIVTTSVMTLPGRRKGGSLPQHVVKHARSIKALYK